MVRNKKDKIMFRRRKVIEKIENSSAMKEAREIDYTQDGRARIYVGAKSADDIFSPFSYKTYELLNPVVVDYINMCVSQLPRNDEISLDIYTEEATTNVEKKRIRQAVKRHNAEQIININKKMKRSWLIGSSFCLFGILVMILTAIFYTQVHKIFIQEILAVIGWMFVWDGLEYILEDHSELMRKKRRCMKLINAKVHVRQYAKKIQREYGFGEFEEEDDDE